MLTVLDLVGTFVFALSGAFKGVRNRLDWLGIVVLAVLTGVGGGLIRDVLLGDTPPAVFRDNYITPHTVSPPRECGLSGMI